jgi:hypothetical protein
MRANPSRVRAWVCPAWHHLIHDFKQPSDFARRRASTDCLPSGTPGLDPGGRRAANAPPFPADAWRLCRATGSSRASRSFPTYIPPRTARERSAARALVRIAAPWCSPASLPERRGKRGSTGTPCEGVPRASDVGARALAALHRGVLRLRPDAGLPDHMGHGAHRRVSEAAQARGYKPRTQAPLPAPPSACLRRTPSVSRDG